MQNNETNDVQKLAKLIKDVKFAMMVTVNPEDKSLRSRPMTLQQTEFDGNLWFFASRTKGPTLDIQDEPKVNLSFAEPKESSYVSICGQAEMVIDKEKAKELWNPALKAWYPQGLEDPELCLIKVMVESADYWESPSSTVVQMVGFAKAVLTGKRAGEEIGERGHLNIN